ncbi:MAG: 1-pyrroline-5-carboxylate dehydrogenase, partial [Microbacteriaceae bacterium]|nr:1-pyrroline-5-carboxylate dehydrogenase [Microbacteriaceae bacterium]
KLEWLRAALGSDAAVIANEYGVNRDASQLGIERNVLRYLPNPVVVRLATDAPLQEQVRVLAAGIAAEADVTVSSPVALPQEIAAALETAGVDLRFEDEAGWASHLGALAAREGANAGARVRIVAGKSLAEEVQKAYAATSGKPDIAIYGGKVVSAGRVEMLPFLREQAVSVTAHRFGTRNHLTDDII